MLTKGTLATAFISPDEWISFRNSCLFEAENLSVQGYSNPQLHPCRMYYHFRLLGLTFVVAKWPYSTGSNRFTKVSHAHLRSIIAVTYRSAPSRMRIRESSLDTRLTVWRTLVENVRLVAFLLDEHVCHNIYIYTYTCGTSHVAMHALYRTIRAQTVSESWSWSPFSDAHRSSQAARRTKSATVRIDCSTGLA